METIMPRINIHVQCLSNLYPLSLVVLSIRPFIPFNNMWVRRGHKPIKDLLLGYLRIFRYLGPKFNFSLGLRFSFGLRLGFGFSLRLFRNDIGVSGNR